MLLIRLRIDPFANLPTPHYLVGSIPSGPDLDEGCYKPTPFENVDYDRFCMCSYYDPETFDAGGVRSWVTCDPYNHEQTKTVHNNDKLSSCINACSKSFEKAKRAAEAGVDLSKRQDEYWFCHAVNFIEGELCGRQTKAFGLIIWKTNIFI
ncbi:hypothetical protein E0Z10_g874 [Xylaria hypoxylon]|uniref:Uncharacterized protein n=1 Tax=Xylaria hypoxylon TaxID=37992 RepID=A0A4Z0YU66_9PEZI|nr:hypothetical protein E0Z10_g874 [Xylaria hypoxylon]